MLTGMAVESTKNNYISIEITDFCFLQQWDVVYIEQYILRCLYMEHTSLVYSAYLWSIHGYYAV